MCVYIQVYLTLLSLSLSLSLSHFLVNMIIYRSSRFHPPPSSPCPVILSLTFSLIPFDAHVQTKRTMTVHHDSERERETEIQL